MSNDKRNKMYGTGTGVKQQVVGYVPVPAKLTSIGENDPDPLFDAFNIDWSSGQYSYDGDPEHIIESTGHLIEIIKSKASASGDVWDDIKDDAYITSQINIYASSSSTNIVPDLIWIDEIENERYDGFTSYSSLPNTGNNFGWYTSVDTIPGNNPYVFMSSIYMVKSLANNILGYHGPSARPIYLSSESGLNGNFKSTVFVRSTETVPDKPYNGAYYDTGLPKEQYVYISGAPHRDVNRISYNKGLEFKCWSDSIPAGNETLWATTAIISDDNGNLDSSAVWSTPRQMTDTATYDVEFAKKQENDATPLAPNSSNSGANPTGTKIWYDPTNDPTENWSEMYWRAERSCINGIWGDWIITRIKGEQGQAGVQGAFKSTAFIRTNKDISNTIPSGGNYNSPVPTSIVTEINGNTATQISWSDGIPNNTEKQLWSTWRTFNPAGDVSQWSNPVKVQDTQYYDVEFSYLFSIASNQKPNDNNRHKETSPYDGQIWFDPTLDPTDNDITGSYTWSDMIWRAERENINGNWSDWVITRIKGEDGLQGTPPRYYQTRYTRTSETTLNTDYYLPSDHCDPTDEVITNHGQNWTTYIPENTNNTPHVWQSSRGVDWYIDNDTNNWAEKWEDGSTWSTPFMLDGLPGESQPIHPVLFYKWALSPTTDEHYTPGDLPSFNKGSINLNDWAESPGNPEGNNRFLWMIQGEYKLNGTTREYQIINGNSYWTNPVCLSGEDGQPGQDGDDLEFIYRVYEGPQNFDDTTLSDYDRPQVWNENSADDYKGEDEDGYFQASIKWTDNPTGVTITHKYEYCSYRRKTGPSGGKSWEKFSEPFPWSIYGENGIDGDGVEYIYYRSDSITPPNSGDTYPPAWTNNSNINEYFQHDDFPCIEEVTGSSWNATTNTGKHNNSYIYQGWTDEPQGVSGNTNEKYEFVSVRKKGFKQGSTTEKEWKPFSSPTLWANYAEDGVATSMVLETDNDNVTVGVDSQNIVNNRYQTIAHIYLQYNGTPINKSYYTLTLSFAKGVQTNFDIENNVIKYRPIQNQPDEYAIISINTNGDTPYLDIDIPKDMNMTGVNNLLSILITATCNSNIGSVTNGDISAGSTFTRIFNLTGVELSIEDIYQIGLSTTTSHRNPRNNGFEPINLWLNSFTSTNTLRTVNEAAAKHIFISYYSTNKNISGVLDPSANSYLRSFDNITLNPNYNKHVFTAYYNSNVNSIDDINNDLIRDDNTKFLDKEEVTGVYDGKNGVDSQSEEYIYLLTDNFDFFKNNTSKYYNVGDWKTNLLSYKDNNGISYYQYNDYPFITNNNYINTESTSYVKSIKYSSSSSYNGSGFIDGDLIIGYWTDNPQGVSAEYPYEFRVPRSYITSASENDRWQAFETPLPWANWGHTGEDGDGVEYIYYRNNSASFDGPNPVMWFGEDNYNTSEYILNNNWKDNPQEVSETNKYEYVSVRKYRKFIYENYDENDNYNYDALKDLFGYFTDGYNYVHYYSNIFNNVIESYQNDIYNTRFNISQGIYDILSIVYNNIIEINNDTFKEDFVEGCINDLPEQDQSNTQYLDQHINEFNDNFENIKNIIYKLINDGIFNFIVSDISGTNYKKLISCESIKKVWCPYSYPALWAKYGERGPQGNSGGSGLVIDFDNDSLQIAVNSNGLIKDNQEITTYIHLYSGQQDITSQISSVSIPNERDTDNNIYNPFNKKYVANNKYGYILNHDSSSYWYTFKVDDCDISNDGEINNNEINPGSLENNLQLPFTISYDGYDYIKRLNFIPIQYGRDGADAETFELMIPESSITYNPNNSNFTPSFITAQIKHVSGSITDIISYNTLYTTYNTNDITWKISYTIPVIAEKDITIDPTDPGSGVRPLSIENGKGGSISEDPSTPAESQHDLLISTTMYSDTVTMNVNNTEYVEWKLWMNNKCVDIETTYIVHDGIKGTDGNDGDPGEPGAQGFTGPTVRYVGEFGKYKQVYDYDGASTTASKLYYGTGKYDSTLYNESKGIIYRDIVSYTNNLGTKYYAPVQTTDNHNYFGRTNMSYHGLYEPFGLCYGAGFVNCYSGKVTNYPTTPNGTLNSNWVEATNFDFVATKLLYADQALINQISTHDLIATDSNGYPVAGITSGSKMYDKDGTEITSIISTGTNSGNSVNDVYISSTDPVRIFAGEIHDETPESERYTLTYAPFNVRQSGTAYMKNAYISGEITANTLKLGPDSFWNVTTNDYSKILPQLHGGQTLQYIILTNGVTDANVRAYKQATGSNPDTFKLSVGAQATHATVNVGGTTYNKLMLKPNKLYQCISVDHTWNVNEITLKIPDEFNEHYDCSSSVTIFGAANYLSTDNDYALSYYIPNQSVGFLPRAKTLQTTTHNDNDLEFSFFAYIQNNYYTSEGVNICLGEILCEQPASSPSN